MRSDFIPNSFQTPNAVVDRLLPLLTSDELKVLLFAMRHILGWNDKITQRRTRLALSVFSVGFVTQDGNVYGGTGLSIGTIRKVMRLLESARIMARCKDASGNDDLTNQGQMWELSFDNVDYDLLEKRQLDINTRNRRQTEKARAAQPLMSDNTPHVSHQYPPDVTHNPPPDVTQQHINTSKRANKTTKASATLDASSPAKKPTTPRAELNAMCEAIVAAMAWDRDLISQGQWGAIRTGAKQLIEIGCKLDEVIYLKRECDARQYRGYSAPALAKVAVDVLPRIRKPKTNTTPDDTESPAPDATSFQERLQANLRYSQMMQGGNDGDAG